MWGVLILVAVSIIVGLSIYAVKLTAKVKKQEQNQRDIQAVYEEKKRKQEAYLVESLQVISANALAQELNLSEATIRCKMLIEGLDLPEERKVDYLILEEVYHLLKNFDTHDSRKKLSSEERKKQDADRVEIEQKYKPELLKCFGLLSEFRL